MLKLQTTYPVEDGEVVVSYIDDDVIDIIADACEIDEGEDFGVGVYFFNDCDPGGLLYLQAWQFLMFLDTMPEERQFSADDEHRTFKTVYTITTLIDWLLRKPYPARVKINDTLFRLVGEQYGTA